MAVISLLLLAGAALSALTGGFSIQNIIFMVFAAIFAAYSHFFMKKQKSALYRIGVPAALIVITLVVSSLFSPYRADAAFGAKYAKALGQISRGDYEKSLSLLEELDKERPNDSQVNQALGILYMRMENFDTSWNYLVKANSLDPYDIDTLFNMGLNRYHRGIPNEARNIFETVTARAPRLFKAHVYAGTISMELNDYKRAVYHLENARFLDPGAAAVHIYLAECSISFMQYEQAAEYLGTALDNSPTKTQQDKIETLEKIVEIYTGGDRQ